MGCLGVSEEEAGSDVARIRTTARSDGDDYIISGNKMWITNGMQADWMCTLVNTSEGHPHYNKSLVIIPMDLPGVERSRKLHKLGMWASDTVANTPPTTRLLLTAPTIQQQTTTR